MQFTITAVVAILAAIVEARPQFTNSNFAVEADKPFTLTWSDAVGPVTITLKDGPSTNLKTVSTLASGLTGNSATVTVKSSDIQSGTYAFAISDTSGDPENYSQQFNLIGSGSASSSSISSSATPSGSSSAASSTVSSASRTATTSASNTSASATSVANSTTSSATSSASRTAATPTAAATTVSAPNTGAGVQLKSSFALAFLGVAAFAFLN